MATRIRAYDWTTTPLGPIGTWSERLRLMVEQVLANPLVSSLVCGPERVLIYNAAAAALYGDRHPAALGRPLPEAFPEGWATVAPFYARAFAGETVQVAGQPLDTRGEGEATDVFDAVLTPVREADGRIAFVHMTGFEIGARMRVEAALRASEARHRLLIESWAQAVWETDAAGVVVADSPSWRAYTGQTLAEWLGYGWLDAIHPDDRAYAERQWREAVAARGLVDAELRLRSPDGTWRWTNVRAAPLLDEEGEIEKWIGINIDIAGRKHAEEALRQSEAKFRTVFESIDEGFLIHEVVRDESGRPIDLRMLEANPALTRLTGLSQDLIGKLQSTVLPDLEQIWIDTFDRVARTGVPERFENYNQPTERWYNVQVSQVSGHDDRVAVVYDDVTARKRSEIALRESEERQAFLLRLSDGLRSEPDADAVANRALRMLRDQIDVDRCYIAIMRVEENWAEYTHQVGNDRVPSMPNGIRLSDFPKGMQIAFDRSLVIDDLASNEDLSTTDRQSLDLFGHRSLVAAFLRKGVRNAPLWVLVGVCADPRHWRPSDIALVEDTAERTWAAMERARADAALRESEERFQQFARASSAGLWIRDAGTLEMEFASPATGAIYGVEAAALLGDVTRWAGMIVPEDRDRALRHLEEARAGAVTVHEFRIQRPSDGAFRWIRNTDFPLRDGGHIRRIGGLAEDVTDAKRASERLTVLVNELQHRSRNLLGVVTSMANRTVGRGASAESFLVRLKALSRAQALLSQSGSDTVAVEALVRAELAAHADNANDRIIIGGPAVALTSHQVQNFALALHELTTNAVKYGALKNETGRLSVTWESIRTAGGRNLALTWVETGVDIRPGTVTRRGYGRELIEQALAYALGGRTEYVLDAGGVRCRIELPVV